jgi:hypothetical protein
MQLNMKFLLAASLLTPTLAVPASVPAVEGSFARAEAKIATRNSTAVASGAYYVVYSGEGCTGDNFSFSISGGSDICKVASGRSIYWSGDSM